MELTRAREDAQRREVLHKQLEAELLTQRRLLTALEAQLEQELGSDLSAQWRDRGRTGLQQGASLLATSLHTLRRRLVDLQAELEETRARVAAGRAAFTKMESELATTREALEQVSARERNAQQLLSRFRGPTVSMDARQLRDMAQRISDMTMRGILSLPAEEQNSVARKVSRRWHSNFSTPADSELASLVFHNLFNDPAWPSVGGRSDPAASEIEVTSIQPA